jgi:RNA polymerase sigma factor (sigma-70 family)
MTTNTEQPQAISYVSGLAEVLASPATHEQADDVIVQFDRYRRTRTPGPANSSPKNLSRADRRARSQCSNNAVQQGNAELVQRAAAGDELAWRQLIDRFGPLLRHVSSTYRLADAEAEDAVATTWLKLVEHVGSLRDGRAVAGWLVTTLRRECIARARGRERPVAEFAGVDEPVDIVDFDRWLVDADRRRMVHRALRELSEPDRQLIVMLFADPTPSYAEISASLAMPVGSIGPTRMRLLRKLREALSEEKAWELANVG